MYLQGKTAKHGGKSVTIVSDFLVINNSVKLVVMTTNGNLIRVALDDIIVDTSPEFGKIKGIADLVGNS